MKSGKKNQQIEEEISDDPADEDESQEEEDSDDDDEDEDEYEYHQAGKLEDDQHDIDYSDDDSESIGDPINNRQDYLAPNFILKRVFESSIPKNDKKLSPKQNGEEEEEVVEESPKFPAKKPPKPAKRDYDHPLKKKVQDKVTSAKKDQKVATKKMTKNGEAVKKKEETPKTTAKNKKAEDQEAREKKKMQAQAELIEKIERRSMAEGKPEKKFGSNRNGKKN